MILEIIYIFMWFGFFIGFYLDKKIGKNEEIGYFAGVVLSASWIFFVGTLLYYMVEYYHSKNRRINNG